MQTTRSFLALIVLTLCSACSLGNNNADLRNVQRFEFKDENTGSEFAELGLVAGEEVTRLPAPRLEVTKEVERELNTYLARNGAGVRLALKRRDSQYVIAKRIFKDEGLPTELLNLAVIESGFRSSAASPMGAVGLWQFTKGTAKRYGLGNCKVKGDERTDTILSTLAAARHLKELYAKFDDWYLSLAAYNQGEFAVERSIERFNEKSFWKLARKGAFPEETSRFVPKFIAVTIIDKLRDRYGNDDLRAKLGLHLRQSDQLAKVFSDSCVG